MWESVREERAVMIWESDEGTSSTQLSWLLWQLSWQLACHVHPETVMAGFSTTQGYPWASTKIRGPGSSRPTLECAHRNIPKRPEM